jgi:hypothetical protein
MQDPVNRASRRNALCYRLGREGDPPAELADHRVHREDAQTPKQGAICYKENRKKTNICMTQAYENVLQSVESLSRAEQLRLIADLAEHLRTQPAAGRRRSILELQGLGKEIWQGIDAQEYVDRERAAWNG